jgi:acid phosphatase
MGCDSFGFESGIYCRVLVNESPQPLPGCTNGPGESCAGFGMSEWLVQRGEVVGRYGEICGVDYGNSTDVLSIY